MLENTRRAARSAIKSLCFIKVLFLTWEELNVFIKLVLTKGWVLSCRLENTLMFLFSFYIFSRGAFTK